MLTCGISRGISHFIWIASVKTSNGIDAQEQGNLKQVPGAETQSIAVRGSFSFISTDGLTYTVDYIADENGYQPQVSISFQFFCSRLLISELIWSSFFKFNISQFIGCPFTSFSSCLSSRKGMPWSECDKCLNHYLLTCWI